MGDAVFRIIVAGLSLHHFMSIISGKRAMDPFSRGNGITEEPLLHMRIVESTWMLTGSAAVNGAELNVTDKRRCAPLHGVSDAYRNDAAKLLLSDGADADARDGK